jgi:hypothetical protein
MKKCSRQKSGSLLNCFEAVEMADEPELVEICYERAKRLFLGEKGWKMKKQWKSSGKAVKKLSEKKNRWLLQKKF